MIQPSRPTPDQQEEWSVAKQEKAGKGIARKARKIAKRPAARTTRSKKAATGHGPARGGKKVTRKAISAKKATVGKPKPARAAKSAPARKAAPERLVAVTRIAAAAAASPAGEAYGEGSWREELSAAELDTDSPELDELETERGDVEMDPEDDLEW